MLVWRSSRIQRRRNSVVCEQENKANGVAVWLESVRNTSLGLIQSRFRQRSDLRNVPKVEMAGSVEEELTADAARVRYQAAQGRYNFSIDHFVGLSK